MRGTVALFSIVCLVATACAGEWVDEDARQHARRSVALPAPPAPTTTVPSTEPAAYSEGDCPMVIGSDDRDRITCGVLDVAIDRADPSSGRAQVAVAIIASEANRVRPDPVVYLHGGPGGLALSDYIEWVFPEHPLLGQRDVILVDQRGSGWSTPSLNCPAAEGANEPVSALVACRDQLAADGVSLDHFGTADIAADLVDLRVALGLDQWNLYGISYGTRVGLTMLDLDSRAVRAAVFDSPYPPEVDAYREQVANGRTAIDQVLASCAADGRCGAAFGNLADELDAVLDDLAANPVPVEVDEDEARLLVDDGVLASALFSALYDRFTIPDVPLAVQHAIDGDVAGALELLGTADGLRAAVQSEDEQYESLFDAELAFWAPECAEEIELADLDEILASIDGADPLEVALTEEVDSAFDVCARLDVAPADAVDQGPISSDVATLMIVGEFDPITPPAWAVRAASSMADATVIEVTGSGHAPSFEQCPLDTLVAFVEDPDSPPTLPCLTEMRGLPFSVE